MLTCAYFINMFIHATERESSYPHVIAFVCPTRFSGTIRYPSNSNIHLRTIFLGLPLHRLRWSRRVRPLRLTAYRKPHPHGHLLCVLTGLWIARCAASFCDLLRCSERPIMPLPLSGVGLGYTTLHMLGTREFQL